MPRVIDGIFELIFHLQGMDQVNKSHFKKFIGKYRFSKSLNKMIAEFEKSNPYEPAGFLYHLIRNLNGKDYKTYLRLKKQLFEFELSSKRIDFFRKEDIHLYMESYLKKEVLAANILLEQNAHLNAIQILNEASNNDGIRISVKKCSIRDMIFMIFFFDESKIWVAGRLDFLTSKHNQLKLKHCLVCTTTIPLLQKY